MAEPSEPELIRTPDERLPPSERTATGPWPLIALVALIGALLFGGYWFLRASRSAPPEAAPAVAAPPAEPAAPPPTALGSNPFPAEVPALAASDLFVRTWLPRLSQHPRVMAWLATDGLIRNFVTVVTNIAEGRTPAGRVPMLKPAGSFRIVERNGRLYVDDRAYARYDALAEGFASLDATAAAQLYATLKPRIEEAHAELGGAGSFDATLERALVQLLATPIGDRPMAVEPSGIGYRAVDARLDGLTGVQKQLLRMGPSNAGRVQAHLRELARALGVPASRLPAVAPT